MFRKGKENSPDRGEYSGKITLSENHDYPASEGADDKLGEDEEKKFKWQQDEKLSQTADARFSITEPTYDFKHLDSPCTITSRSSLAPVTDEERQLVSNVNGDSSEDTSTHFSTSSMELASDSTVECSSSSDAAPLDNQKITAAASSSRASSEHHRQLRKKRKIFTNEECPVCGVTVRQQDIEEHYKCELKKLDSLKRKLKKPRKELSCANKKLEQVKANRAKRSRSCGSKYMKDAAVSTCMVCNPELLDDQSAVHSRALLHLTECVGVGEDLLEEALQEYSLEDESRRIISFVDHVDSMSYNRIENVEDENSPVNVDSDNDDIIYGSPQFTEQNLIVCASDLSDAGQSALREAVLSCSSSDEDVPPPLEVPPANTENGTAATYDSPNFSEGSDVDENENRRAQENNQSTSSALISALKSRIEDLEEELQTKSVSKCNICLEHYKNPLVSVTCWHVSCEECWMKTLGVKKLCPQCSKITLPTSLRRIYL